MSLAGCSAPDRPVPVASSATATPPAPVASPLDAVDLALGDGHACRVLRSGAVSCWGRNDHGQLGDGSLDERPEPRVVPSVEHAVSIAAGGTSTCAIDSQGSLHCWGRHPAFGDRRKPQRIEAPKLRSVALTRSHWVGVAEDGRVVTDAGPLPGDPSAALEVKADWWAACVRMADEIRCFREVGMLTDLSGPSVVQKVRATAVAAGLGAACAIEEKDASLACWNEYGGHKGIGPVRAVAMDDAHACAVAADGRVACWAGNRAGEVGSDTLDSDNQIATGYPPHPLAWVEGIKDARRVAVGGNTACAVLASGDTACWGSNTWGQLGSARRSMFRAAVPVAGLREVVEIAGTRFEVLALLGDGTVRSWGNYERSREQAGAAIREEPLPPVKSLVAANTEVCALLRSGEVRCRRGVDFEAPQNPWSPVPGVKASAIAGRSLLWQSGGGQLITDDAIWYALDDAGALTVWEGGATPRGPIAVRGLPKVLSVGSGLGHTCAVLAGGVAECWHQEQVFQALSAGARSVSPRRRKLHLKDAERAIGPCVFGAGGAAACFHTSGGPDGSLHEYTPPAGFAEQDNHAVCALSTAGILSCPPDDPDAMVLAGVKGYAVGIAHGCAALSDGSVRCWGNNDRGAVGQPLGERTSVPRTLPRDAAKGP